MSGTVRLFVYGSLLPGLDNYDAIEPYAVSSREGQLKGRLVDCGPYPALVPDAERTVRGLWMEVSLAGLKGLDELEGFLGIEEENDYERVWARDAEFPEVEGWVYVWTETRGCPWVDGDYWPDAIRAKKEHRDG